MYIQEGTCIRIRDDALLDLLAPQAPLTHPPNLAPTRGLALPLTASLRLHLRRQWADSPTVAPAASPLGRGGVGCTVTLIFKVVGGAGRNLDLRGRLAGLGLGV